MTQIAERPHNQFAVDDVLPATERLPECPTFEAIKETLDGPIESCFDYHGTVVKNVHYQPLLAAVYMAFSQHRPLVLTPDAVWITIAQGIAHHVAIHGEQLRPRLVTHQGKLDLVCTVKDWVKGSPENPWADAFAEWSNQIRQHVGPTVHDVLACDFSTSGPVEQAVGQIVMMDIFERYFRYVLICVCGIPSITLEGTPADWQRLREKAEGLRIFDVDWWLKHLLPICDQFVRASKGDIDLKHWQSICKLREAYGGDIINGWIAKLFPYLRAFSRGPCTRRNPIFESGEGFQTLVAPSGLSQVPFLWIDLLTNQRRDMEAIGGLVGVAQDQHTLALRPKVGWAIRKAGMMSKLLSRLDNEHETHSRYKADGDERWQRADEYLPPDLDEFYHHTDGANLSTASGSMPVRILPRRQMKPLNWCENMDEGLGSRGPEGRIWHQFAALGDGSWLAINLDLNLGLILDRHAKMQRQDFENHETFKPIIHGSPATQATPGRNPVIAWSFTELLERLLDCGGQPYWLKSDFKSYGDAEQFTRRESIRAYRVRKSKR